MVTNEWESVRGNCEKNTASYAKPDSCRFAVRSDIVMRGETQIMRDERGAVSRISDKCCSYFASERT